MAMVNCSNCGKMMDMRSCKNCRNCNSYMCTDCYGRSNGACSECQNGAGMY